MIEAVKHASNAVRYLILTYLIVREWTDYVYTTFMRLCVALNCLLFRRMRMRMRVENEFSEWKMWRATQQMPQPKNEFIIILCNFGNPSISNRASRTSCARWRFSQAMCVCRVCCFWSFCFEWADHNSLALRYREWMSAHITWGDYAFAIFHIDSIVARCCVPATSHR